MRAQQFLFYWINGMILLLFNNYSIINYFIILIIILFIINYYLFIYLFIYLLLNYLII